MLIGWCRCFRRCSEVAPSRMLAAPTGKATGPPETADKNPKSARASESYRMTTQNDLPGELQTRLNDSYRRQAPRDGRHSERTNWPPLGRRCFPVSRPILVCRSRGQMGPRPNRTLEMRPLSRRWAVSRRYRQDWRRRVRSPHWWAPR